MRGQTRDRCRWTRLPSISQVASLAGRFFPCARKETKGTPGGPSEWSSGTFRARGPAAKRWARVQPPLPAKEGPRAPPLDPPRGYGVLRKTGQLSLNTSTVGRLASHIATLFLYAQSSRPPEGGSNGGNRRAVSPLAGRRGSWGNLSEGSPMRFFFSGFLVL